MVLSTYCLLVASLLDIGSATLESTLFAIDRGAVSNKTTLLKLVVAFIASSIYYLVAAS